MGGGKLCSPYSTPHQIVMPSNIPDPTPAQPKFGLAPLSGFGHHEDVKEQIRQGNYFSGNFGHHHQHHSQVESNWRAGLQRHWASPWSLPSLCQSETT